LRKKKYFAEEIRQNNLGSPVTEELLYTLKPHWWFAAHLHVKFLAQVLHSNDSHGNHLDDFIIDTTPECSSRESLSDSAEQVKTTNFVGNEISDSKLCHNTPDLTTLLTQFLSLDKCLPRRQHLLVVNIPQPTAIEMDSASVDLQSKSLHYDIEWLAVLRKTHNWTIKSHARVSEPDCSSVHISDQDRYEIINRLRMHRQTDSAESQLLSRLTEIPSNFSITVLPHGSPCSEYPVNNGRMIGNPQTDDFLNLLGLCHIVTTPFMGSVKEIITDFVGNETKIDDNATIHYDANEIDLDSDL